MTPQTVQAREWILELPPGTWFNLDDLPVKAEIARPVLSRLKNDERHAIYRVAPKLYWRGYAEGHPFHSSRPNEYIAALIHGGPGAGYSHLKSLNILGWTTQCPVRIRITVVGRPPASIRDHIAYTSNSNQRRLNLSWAEVTILEALDYVYYSEERWYRCVDTLANGISAARMIDWNPNQSIIRPEALEWAYETEKKQTPEKESMIDDLVVALNDSETKKVA